MKKSKYTLSGKTIAGTCLIIMIGLWFNPANLLGPVTPVSAAQAPNPAGATSPIRPNGAKVTASKLNLREGPGTNFAVIGSLQAGTALTVTNRSVNSDWIEVITPNNQRGWVCALPGYVSLNINLAQVFVSPKPVLGLEISASPPSVEAPIPLASRSLDGREFGLTEFVWRWDGQLAANQGFEVRIWREGEQPLGIHDAVSDNKLGRIESLRNNTYRLVVDISKTPAVKGSGKYLWIVLVVQIDPYIDPYQARPEVGIAAVTVPPRQVIPTPLGNPNYAKVKVFYGTDRNITTASNPDPYYGKEMAQFSYGIAEVSIPRNHKPGELESPSIWRFEFRPDPEKHIVLLSVSPQNNQSFFTELRARITETKKKEAFVFIHGYNVSFQAAVQRTAQMAKDLSLDAAPILYSWPSNADNTLWAYRADETDVAATVQHLQAFLAEIAQYTGVETVHLIAHSMGNQALVKALSSGLTGNTARVLRQVVLAAPDVDTKMFNQNFAPKLIAGYPSVTLYASSKDKALGWASKLVHLWQPRAGDAGASLVILKGLDTIDASKVDTDFLGHGYYAENLQVIADLCYLFKAGKVPKDRGLEPAQLQGKNYWKFNPQSTEPNFDECVNLP